MADAHGTIKGTSIQLTLELVRKRHGDDGVRRVIEGLPAPVREMLPPALAFLPASTWPFELWAELLVSAEDAFGSIARESARLGYAELLRTAYRNWVRPGDPAASIRNMPHLWRQVTSGLGDYEAVERGASELPSIRVRLHAVAPRYRTVTEERVAGTLEAMVEAAGARARVERHAGAEWTEFVIELGVRG